VHTEFWWGNLKERENLEDPDVDWGQYRDGSTGSGLGGRNWIDLAQDRYRWRDLVSAVMNLQVPYIF